MVHNHDADVNKEALACLSPHGWVKQVMNYVEADCQSNEALKHVVSLKSEQWHRPDVVHLL